MSAGGVLGHVDGWTVVAQTRDQYRTPHPSGDPRKGSDR